MAFAGSLGVRIHGADCGRCPGGTLSGDRRASALMSPNSGCENSPFSRLVRFAIVPSG